MLMMMISLLHSILLLSTLVHISESFIDQGTINDQRSQITVKSDYNGTGHDFNATVNIGSQYNATINCWQSVIVWKMENSCSLVVDVTLYKNMTAINLINSTVSECVSADETNVYNLVLDTEQMTNNISINYTSPSINKRLSNISTDTMYANFISSSGFQLSFRLNISKGLLTPYIYMVYVYRGADSLGDLISNKSFSCASGRSYCFPDIRTQLTVATEYSVRVESSTEFAGETFKVLSDIYSFTTENCTKPDPVTLNHITVLQIRHNPSQRKVSLTFTPGDLHCYHRASYMMYYVSDHHSNKVSCDLRYRSCEAVLNAFTRYTFTIETVTSFAFSSSLTLDPWWFPNSAITPSPPTNLRSSIRFDGTVSITWTWAPPLQPNGEIVDYSYRITSRNRDSHHIEISTYFNSTKLLSHTRHNVSVEHTFSMEVQAGTRFMWSEYTHPVVINVPSTDLPRVNEGTVSAYPDSSGNGCCIKVSLTTSLGGNLMFIDDRIETKITCRPLGCSNNSCSVVYNQYSNWTTREPVISVCGLKPCMSYNCTTGFTNAYNLTSEDSYRFSVYTNSSFLQDLLDVKSESVKAYPSPSSKYEYCMNIYLNILLGKGQTCIIDFIKTKTICRPAGCSEDICSLLRTDFSTRTTREPMITECGLKPCISYNCTMGFTNAYNLSREDSYQFIVQTKSTETQDCDGGNPNPDPPKPDPRTSTSIGVVIGAVIAAVVVVALLVTVIVLIIRRRRDTGFHSLEEDITLNVPELQKPLSPDGQAD